MKTAESENYNKKATELYETTQLLLGRPSEPEPYSVRVQRGRGAGLATWYDNSREMGINHKKK